jgi:hypothetical protein
LAQSDFAPGTLLQGPAGETGSQGVPGTPGAPGQPGRSALTELQPGETVRGRVGGEFDEDVAGGDWGVSVSYPIPASSPPTAASVDGVTDDGSVCTGSATNPTAPAGTLCVYPQGAVNPVLGSNNSSHFIVNATVVKYGFELRWVTTAGGDTNFRGNYAFTQGP